MTWPEHIPHGGPPANVARAGRWLVPVERIARQLGAEGNHGDR
jgi:hypothetical protein